MPEQIGRAGNVAMTWAKRATPFPIHQDVQEEEKLAENISRMYGGIEMVLAFPPDGMSPVTNMSGKNVKIRDNVQPAVKKVGKNEFDVSPRVNLAKVADKVYRLMRSDLILEKERTAKRRGKL